MIKELPPTVVTLDGASEEGCGKPESAAKDMQHAARHYRTVRLEANGKAAEALDSWSSSVGSAPAKLLCEMFRSDAASADRLAHAVTSLPSVGEQFLGFRLVALLGSGAFGRVFLAEQGDLANRRVALKVAADIFGESQTLAQLQHTNIVPVYSMHRAHPFQAVCMPYFGATTLADVLTQLHGGSSLPHSGKMLVSTVNGRILSTRRSASSAVPAEQEPATPAGTTGPLDGTPVSLPSVDAAAALQKLEGMTYVEAVLWIAARLADGLAHAHEHGILHRDLKPANILLTDDGQPMLLDFNLSEDIKLRTHAGVASVGGTLPYMAPEHLEALRGKNKKLDERSDVYSLGVILYELLTGRALFPMPRAMGGDPLENMIAERTKAKPEVRRFNATVSPAVESIVRHCLHADPDQRYQNARQLEEDLERQLHNQVLRHAPDPSPRERLRKWSRRHPRLASSATIATLLGVLLLSLTSALVLRDRRLARFEANAGLKLFQDEMNTVQFKLYSRHADRDELEDGIERSRQALGLYQVLDNSRWRELPAVQNLPAQDRQRLEEEAGELLFLLARATALKAQYYVPVESREEKLQEALHLSMLAETCFGDGQCPKALWEQRADLARLLGRDDEARKYRALFEKLPPRSARDLYLIAHKQTIEGNYRAALEGLRKTTQEDPRNFSAWFVRGNCYYELLQDMQAIACYNTCIGLRPEFHWAWFDRGLAYLRLRNFRQASEDFDQVLRLQPDLTEAYINRALAEQGTGKYQEAINDLTRALSGAKVLTRIYFLRAEVRAQAGDRLGAQRDFDQGLAALPTDEASWVRRGLAKQGTDLAGALADFEQALKINPRSFEGLQNKAAALDRLGKDQESLKVQEQTVALYPESVLARLGRGVLLARVQKRAAAIEDARAALLLDTSPSTLYQAACIYALTSRQDRDDVLQALHLLAAALRGGYGLDIVDSDTDLDPLRKLPEFKQALAAAQVLQSDGAKQPK